MNGDNMNRSINWQPQDPPAWAPRWATEPSRFFGLAAVAFSVAALFRLALGDLTTGLAGTALVLISYSLLVAFSWVEQEHPEVLTWKVRENA